MDISGYIYFVFLPFHISGIHFITSVSGLGQRNYFSTITGACVSIDEKLLIPRKNDVFTRNLSGPYSLKIMNGNINIIHYFRPCSTIFHVVSSLTSRGCEAYFIIGFCQLQLYMLRFIVVINLRQWPVSRTHELPTRRCELKLICY